MEAKETYYGVKSDLPWRQKRPTRALDLGECVAGITVSFAENGGATLNRFFFNFIFLILVYRHHC